jgi:Na+/phosphate symporter
MYIYLSLLIAIIGVLMYGFVTNPKLQEVGRIMFWVGLLVFLWHFAGPAHIIGEGR